MSQAVHAVSKSPAGPFKREDLVIPTQAHNTYYAYSQPDQMHLIYHIFSGENPESCNPYLKCTNGSTPNGHGLRPPSTPWPKPTCSITNGGAHVHYSKSLNGPWLSAGKLTINTTGMPPAAGSSNPAPYIFPNGTVLMMGRGKDSGAENRQFNHNIFLYRADHWNSTYQWVRGTGVDGSVNIGNGKMPTEDPTIYRGRRGFHALIHSHPDLTHAWSETGMVWNWSSALTGPSDVPVGSDNERPRVMVDENGDLDLVFVSREVGTGDAAQLAAFQAL